MLNFIRSRSKPLSSYIKKSLLAYTCSYRNNTVHVCCPSAPIVITEEPTTRGLVMTMRKDESSSPTSVSETLINTETVPVGKTDSPPDVSSHENLHMLPTDECGYLDNQDKIRNGQMTALNEFPWMALLSYKTGIIFLLRSRYFTLHIITICYT